MLGVLMAMAYKVPSNPHGAWETTVIDNRMHKTHNLEVATNLPKSKGQDTLIIAGVEGVFIYRPENGSLNRRQVIVNEEGASDFVGAGEVRSGNLPGGGMFITTAEPMHGNQLVSYTPPARNSGKRLGIRNVLFDEMVEGHALSFGDLLGIGSDQVVICGQLWLFCPPS